MTGESILLDSLNKIFEGIQTALFANTDPEIKAHLEAIMGEWNAIADRLKAIKF